jgi:hypothetical protein
VRLIGESDKPPLRKDRPSSGNGHEHEAAVGPGRSRQKRAPHRDGEMAKAFGFSDWASTNLGSVSKWSGPVRRAVAICASIASKAHEALISADWAQRWRVAELSRQNDCRLVAGRNATLDA